MDTYVYSCGRYNGLFCPPFPQKQDAAAMKIPDFPTSEQSLITRTCCAEIDIRMNVYTVTHKSGRTQRRKFVCAYCNKYCDKIFWYLVNGIMRPRLPRL